MTNIDKKIKKNLSAERRRRAENSMSDKCFFSLKNVDENSYDMVEKLNRIFGPIGAEFKIEHRELSDDISSDSLVVFFRPEHVKYKTKRAAGRKRNYVSYEEDGVTYRATVNRVRALIDKYGSVRAASMIGMNKSGMYKRLKKAQDAGIRLSETDRDALGADDILF